MRVRLYILVISMTRRWFVEMNKGFLLKFASLISMDTWYMFRDDSGYVNGVSSNYKIIVLRKVRREQNKTIRPFILKQEENNVSDHPHILSIVSVNTDIASET